MKGAMITMIAARVVKDVTGTVPGTSTASGIMTGRGIEIETGTVTGTERDVGTVTGNVTVPKGIGRRVGTVIVTGSETKGTPRIDAGRGTKTMSWIRTSVPRGRSKMRVRKSHHCLRPLRLQVFLRLRLHCLIALADVEMAHANANAGTGTGVPELAIRATSSMTCRVIAVIGTKNANRPVAGVGVRLYPWRSPEELLP